MLSEFTINKASLWFKFLRLHPTFEWAGCSSYAGWTAGKLIKVEAEMAARVSLMLATLGNSGRLTAGIRLSNGKKPQQTSPDWLGSRCETASKQPCRACAVGLATGRAYEEPTGTRSSRKNIRKFNALQQICHIQFQFSNNFFNATGSSGS